MSAQFVSQQTLYKGNYLFEKYKSDYEFNHGLHYHDFYEVQLYTSDAGTLVINGKEYPVKRGAIALINIFEPHMLLLNPSTYKNRMSISIAPSFILSSCSEHSNLLSIFNSNNKNYPLVHLDDSEFDRYTSIMNRYNNINMTLGRDIMERAILYELLANLYNLFYDGRKSNPVDTQYIGMIIKLVRFIEDHISEDLSLERLSAEVNFSKSHLCRIFKKYTGYTINKYIVSKRIEKSKLLLDQTESITEACKITGFNNYSYFYKTFKKTYGVNPAEYKAAEFK